MKTKNELLQDIKDLESKIFKLEKDYVILSKNHGEYRCRYDIGTATIKNLDHVLAKITKERDELKAYREGVKDCNGIPNNLINT